MTANEKIITASKYCLKCQYVLDGLDRNRCPECGQEFDPADGKSFLSSIPVRHPKWAIFWLLLALWGFATGGEVLLHYFFSSTPDYTPKMYRILWFSFCLSLAAFATVHAIRLFGNQRLHAVWIKQRWFRITTRITKSIMIFFIVYCMLIGPMFAASIGRRISRDIFTAIYIPVLALDSYEIKTIQLMFKYMNICSDSTARKMWKQSVDYEKQGEYQKALDAISNFMNPNVGKRRAHLYYKLGDYSNALQSTYFTNMTPRDIAFRGHLYHKLGEYDNSMYDSNEAIRRDPDLAVAHNNLAWLFATCPNRQYQKGELAVEHAKKACELTNWEQSFCVNTLAAAYGEVGDFELAIETLEKAIELDPELAVETRREMMGCFVEGKAYREEIKKGE